MRDKRCGTSMSRIVFRIVNGTTSGTHSEAIRFAMGPENVNLWKYSAGRLWAARNISHLPVTCFLLATKIYAFRSGPRRCNRRDLLAASASTYGLIFLRGLKQSPRPCLVLCRQIRHQIKQQIPPNKHRASVPTNRGIHLTRGKRSVSPTQRVRRDATLSIPEHKNVTWIMEPPQIRSDDGTQHKRVHCD
jgi:hypothetical protein